MGSINVALRLFTVFPVFLITLVLAERCDAESVRSELESGFTVSFPVYLWVRQQDVPHDSVLNPRNEIARIPETVRLLEFRPDLSQRYKSVTLNIKPRFQAIDETIDTTEIKDKSDSDAFINEAGIQFAAQDSWYLSFAREVFLWGPSMFVSISNPFFTNNGRADPFTELGGRDFAKLTHVMDASWNMIYMSNTGIGRDVEPVTGFEPISAIKLDYLGDAFYTSFIVSKEQDQNTRLGGYFGMTASTALLLYAEATLIEGSNALYPVRTISPSGWDMAPITNENEMNKAALAGFGYTFMNALTVNVEYVHNSLGYSDKQAKDYYLLAKDASEQFLADGSASLLGAANNTNLQLLRRNYVFTQLNYPDPKGNLDWTVRYALNLDDNSASFNASMTWYVTDNANIIFLGLLNKGGRTTEYGSYIDSLVQLGVTYYLW